MLCSTAESGVACTGKKYGQFGTRNNNGMLHVSTGELLLHTVYYKKFNGWTVNDPQSETSAVGLHANSRL